LVYFESKKEQEMIKITSHPERVTKQSLVWKDVEEGLKKERRKVAGETGRLAEELETEWQERDSPSEKETREVEYRHREALQIRLRDIDDALERMRYKTYGSCIDCKKKIAVRRLFNDLTVSHCLACQTIADGNVSETSL
jgi:RNA polymerase-binding transcription factor DksA